MDLLLDKIYMNFINRHVVSVSFLIDSDDIEDVDAETHPIHFQVSLLHGWFSKKYFVAICASLEVFGAN